MDRELGDLAETAVSNWMPADEAGFRTIQLEQFRHDERFHREITRLAVKERLTHMALHFAKYAGYLAEGVDDASYKRVVTDIFVIGVTTANSLNVRLFDALQLRGPIHARNVDDLTQIVTINAGRMAAACEKLDHLESFPYRQTVQDAAVALVAVAICVANQHGWDVRELVRDRLQPVKEKSIFYGDL